MASTVLPNGIIIPEKFSRDWYADLYHNWQELDNLLGGGTPKDGTLTIQKNGSTVGTFSANQATNETVNIEVPTATSELTNDSNFVESSDLATVATSGSYTDLSDKPTIPTVNNATLTIQQNGTTVDTFTANSSSDKTANIQCVDLTSNQTIGGIKNFSNEVTMFGRDINLMSRLHYGKNSNPSASTWQYLFFRGNTATEGYTNSWYSGYIEQRIFTDGSVQCRWFVQDTSENPVALEIWASGNDKQVRPFQNGNTDLGTSTKKWKSFNGINPGALSLPSMNYINLDTANFDVTSTTIGTFTPTVDGWAILSMSQKNKPFGIWLISGAYRESFQSARNNDDYLIFALIPVRANVTMTVYCTADDIDSTRKVDWLRLFPCQGNV